MIGLQAASLCSVVRLISIPESTKTTMEKNDRFFLHMLQNEMTMTSSGLNKYGYLSSYKYFKGESARSREDNCYLLAHKGWFTEQVKQILWMQAVNLAE